MSSEMDAKAGPNTRSRKRKAPEEPDAETPGVPTAASAPRRKTTKEPPRGDCCICMTPDVADADLASVDGCEHKFCFGCIERWAERENTCPLCKARFAEIRRDRKQGGPESVKKVKRRDQRSDVIPSAALEGLLASFASRSIPSQSIARLIFSGTAAGAGATDGFFEIRGGTDDRPPPEPHTFGGLFRAMHGYGLLVGAGGGGGGFQIVRPMAVGQSFASNVDDATAGNRPENPLEIDDDTDDDGEIEVVRVRQNA